MEKKFKVKYPKEKNILIGETEEPDGSTTPATGIIFDSPTKTTQMQDLQLLFPSTIKCSIRPDWIQQRLAIYRKATLWDPHTHLPNNVALSHSVPLRQSASRQVWSTTPEVNSMINQLLSFFLRLHVNRYVLGDFRPSDFMVVEGDPIPKFWRSEFFAPTRSNFEHFRQRNFAHLSRFLREYLELQFSKINTHPYLPLHTDNFLDMLLNGKTENLKEHVQMVGFAGAILAFKSILDRSIRVIERLKREPTCLGNIGTDWLCLLREFNANTVIVQRTNGEYTSSWRASIEDDDRCTMILSRQRSTFDDGVGIWCGDLFMYLWNFLRQLSDHSEDSYAAMLYLVVEDKFPGLIWQFLNAIHKYPAIR